jgi:hypothetical protein
LSETKSGASLAAQSWISRLLHPGYCSLVMTQSDIGRQFSKLARREDSSAVCRRIRSALNLSDEQDVDAGLKPG